MAEADYNDKIEETIRKLWEYSNDENDWKHLKTSSDLVIHQKKSDVFDGTLYKVERRMNVSPQRLIDLFYDMEFLKVAEKGTKSVDLIETIGGPDKAMITRTVTDSALFGLVSAREVVALSGVRYYPDKKVHVLVSVGISHPKCPEDQKNLVRVITYPSGRFIYAVDGQPNWCRLVEFAQSDGKLSMPKVVVEQAAPGAIKDKVEYFNKMVAKHDKAAAAK
ncbi:stAR-related lipid transfer protein 5-like [Ptychodera flava]|uniref:stAR-related lipid transfer protein 5-like n=1 Tax=Ptychodera flava TaxID=63121 RepID=UPI00396A8542